MTVIGNGIPLIRVHGSPYERGLQHGKAIPEMIHSRIRRAISHNQGPAEKADAMRVADKVEKVLAVRLPETLEELHGIADGAGADWDDLRLAVLAGGGGLRYLATCSIFAATRTATSDGHLIIGAGGDLNPPVLTDQDFFVRVVHPSRGYGYVTMGVFPERPIQPEGMNERGVTIVGVGQSPVDGKQAYREDLPVGVSLYESMQWVHTECATIDDVLKVLRDSPRGYTGRTMIVGDASGEWAKVEVTYNHIEVLRPEPDALYAANFVTAGVSGTYVGPTTHSLVSDRGQEPDQYDRYDRYMTLLTQNAGKIDLDFAQRLLRDHSPTPGSSSICRHSAVSTLDAMLFAPESRKVWVLKGRPCENAFYEVETPTAIGTPR
jgi:isopenicillin-N N-acyltransferase-like protein